MGRRGRGEGSIRRRPDGIFEARLTIAPGRVKSLYGKTRTEAAQKLNALKAELLQGNRVIDANTRLGDYLAAWLASKTLKPATHRIYSRAIESLRPSCIWTVRLPDLTGMQIRYAYKEDLEETKPRMLSQLDEMLRSAINSAVEDGLLRYSPMLSVPRVKRAKVEYGILTQDQAAKFLEAARTSTPYGALFVVALTTGAREGELLALEWADIDFERRTMRINKNLSEQEGEGKKRQLVVLAPKTTESVRTVDLPEIALDALYNHKKSRAKYLNCPVFSGARGKQTRATNLLGRHFHPLLEKLRAADPTFPDITFHDLRHTCATHLLQAGEPPHNVSKLLGHASVAVTMTIYGHALPDSGKRTAKAIDTLYGVVKG